MYIIWFSDNSNSENLNNENSESENLKKSIKNIIKISKWEII